MGSGAARRASGPAERTTNFPAVPVSPDADRPLSRAAEVREAVAAMSVRFGVAPIETEGAARGARNAQEPHGGERSSRPPRGRPGSHGRGGIGVGRRKCLRPGAEHGRRTGRLEREGARAAGRRSVLHSRLTPDQPTRRRSAMQTTYVPHDSCEPPTPRSPHRARHRPRRAGCSPPVSPSRRRAPRAHDSDPNDRFRDT